MMPSYQKFEWNAHGENLNLKNKLISFRPSGIRVKRSNVAPTLISMTTTQTPIIGNLSSKLEKNIDLYIQRSFKTSRIALSDLRFEEKYKFFLPAVGNAVNVKVVNLIAKNLLFFNVDNLLIFGLLSK